MSKILATPKQSTRVTDKQISPPVKCFCCQDSGLVSNIYITEFVEIPDHGDILPYICQRENCVNGRAYLKAYEMSDQERDAYHNTQLRNGKDADGLPRPMKAKDYQANFSTNLNQACCDWLHDRSFDDWVEGLRKPPAVAIASQYSQKVEDRDRRILEIQQAIAEAESQGANLSSKIQKTVQMCSDRDGITYQDWKFLPSGDHQRMLDGIKGLKLCPQSA